MEEKQKKGLAGWWLEKWGNYSKAHPKAGKWIYEIFYFWVFLGHAHSMYKFPGQGSNTSHSSNTESLTTRLPGNSQVWFINQKLNTLIHHINRLKEKKITGHINKCRKNIS